MRKAKTENISQGVRCRFGSGRPEQDVFGSARAKLLDSSSIQVLEEQSSRSFNIYSFLVVCTRRACFVCSCHDVCLSVSCMLRTNRHFGHYRQPDGHRKLAPVRCIALSTQSGHSRRIRRPASRCVLKSNKSACARDMLLKSHTMDDLTATQKRKACPAARASTLFWKGSRRNKRTSHDYCLDLDGIYYRFFCSDLSMFVGQTEVQLKAVFE